MDDYEDSYNEDEDYYNHEDEETPEKVYADVQLDDTIPSYLRDVATNKGKYYLTNEDLLPEVLKSVAAGKISERLGKMLLLLTDRYSRKFSFVRYSYREDMVGYALINLCKTALIDSDKEIIHGMNLLLMRPDKKVLLPSYANYYFSTDSFKLAINTFLA